MDTGRIIKQAEQALVKRNALDSVWRKCYGYTYPVRGTGFGLGALQGDMQAAASSAASKQDRIYDPTAADCVRLLASAALGGITPRSARWVDLDVTGIEGEERDPWLSEAADAIFAEIHAGNYDTAAFDLLQDVIISGQGVLYIDFDEQKRLRFTSWPLSQCSFEASHEGGVADIIYRRVHMTALQMQSEYGDAVSSSVKQALIEGSDKPFEVLHAIYPREGGKHGAQADGKPFASCHIEVGTKTLLRESGYDVQPFVVARWQLMDGGAYAVGPVYSALPTIQSLNELQRIILEKAEFAVAGMYTLLDDGAIRPDGITVEPGGIIPITVDGAFQPVAQSGSLQVGIAELQDLRAQVRKLLLVEQLNLPQTGNQTAAEIYARMEIMRQILAPVYGRIQTEMLDGLVRRCFDLLMSEKRIPAPPPEAAGWTLQIRYINPVAKSQRLTDVQAMDRFEMALAQEAQIKPEVLDLYDFDKAARERAWLLSVPATLLRDEADVMQMRKQREQAQQAAAQQAQQMQMAQVGAANG